MTRFSAEWLRENQHRVVSDTSSGSKAPAAKQLERERRSTMTEGDAQEEVVRWAWGHRDERLHLLRAYPADGPRVYAYGLVSGTPDLLLPVPSGEWHMLWLELKHPTRERADLSRDQHAEMKRLLRAGHAVEVAWTVDQARWVLLHYLNDPHQFLPGY